MTTPLFVPGCPETHLKEQRCPHWAGKEGAERGGDQAMAAATTSISTSHHGRESWLSLPHPELCSPPLGRSLCYPVT